MLEKEFSLHNFRRRYKFLRRVFDVELSVIRWRYKTPESRVPIGYL
jgi:hypothetical protein